MKTPFFKKIDKFAQKMSEIKAYPNPRRVKSDNVIGRLAEEAVFYYRTVILGEKNVSSPDYTIWTSFNKDWCTDVKSGKQKLSVKSMRTEDKKYTNNDVRLSFKTTDSAYHSPTENDIVIGCSVDEKNSVVIIEYSAPATLLKKYGLIRHFPDDKVFKDKEYLRLSYIRQIEKEYGVKIATKINKKFAFFEMENKLKLNTRFKISFGGK